MPPIENVCVTQLDHWWRVDIQQVIVAYCMDWAAVMDVLHADEEGCPPPHYDVAVLLNDMAEHLSDEQLRCIGMFVPEKPGSSPAEEW